MNNLAVDSKPTNYESRGAGYKVLGISTAWIVEPYIRQGLYLTYNKSKASYSNGAKAGGYKVYAEKAIRQNNINDGLKLFDLNENTFDQLKNELKLNFKEENDNKFFKIMRKILRLPDKSRRNEVVMQTLKGNNAFYIQNKNMVVCNFEKFGSPVFHELGHKLNSKSNNIFMNLLRRLKGSFVYISPIIISGIAFLKDPRDKNDPERNVGDFIKSNCGLLATISVLPLSIEECIASIKGQRIAKKAGVNGEMLKKVTRAHIVSSTSYILLSAFTGIGVFIANKLRDFIALKKVSENKS